MSTVQQLRHDDPKAAKWIDSEIEKIQAAYNLSDGKAEDCSYNAEQCATNTTTAEEWIALFEASIN